LRWTISNSPCTASADDVNITFNRNPTTSAAGPDQTGASTCGLTSVTLAANTPTVGTGAWSIISGAGGTVTTPSSPTSTFSGTAGTAYTLRWTISNSPCTASADDVNITFNRNPTTSAAGPDQTGASTCGLTSVTLAANTPTVGTGAWSIISGAGGTVTTPSSPTSTFSGTAGTAYTLRWTISNSPCTASADDVNITFNGNPTTSAAGPDQTGASTCGLTSVTLAANTPTVGTGAWSIISGAGGTVTTPSSPTSTFSGTAGTAYTLRWTISNSPCTASADDVNITFNQNPTASTSGSATICANDNYTLAPGEATAANGTISWAHNGNGGFVGATNTLTPTYGSVFSDAGNVVTLTMTVTNSPCTPATASYNITVSPNASVGAVTGTTPVCIGATPTYSAASIVLGGGTGAWSSSDNSVATVNTTTGVVTAVSAGTANIIYTITGGCNGTPSSQQTITVDAPTTADAGTDIFDCSDDKIVTLAGNTPTSGVGTWSLVTGPGTPTYSNVNSPSSTALVTLTGIYTYKWTLDNGACTDSDNDVVVYYNNPLPITTTNGASGSCVVADNAWHHIFDANGNVILSINSNGQNLGSVSATVNIGSANSVANNQTLGCLNQTSSTAFMGRDFDIVPTTPPSGNVDVRFYFTAAELADLQAEALANNIGGDPCDDDDDIATIANVDVTKYATGGGPGGTGTFIAQSSNGTGFTANYIQIGTSSFSSFYLHGSGSNAPLPVELISFTATAINNEYIRLDWATALEINNDGFELQRSTDAQTWSNIAWINGNDNSTITNYYNHSDMQVAQNTAYYYRLRQVDNDGQFEFSKHRFCFFKWKQRHF
jgi:hypothetical protein